MTDKPDTRDLYIPFAAAAKAAEISAKRIRNWLDNHDVYLDADEWREDPGKHRRFSRLDIARLGLVARLTTLGFSAERASRVVEQQLYEALCAWRKKRGIKDDEGEEKLTSLFKPNHVFKVPKLRYAAILKDHKKLAHKYGDMDPRRPDPLALNAAETVATCAESEIMDALRDSLMFIEIIGYDVEDYFGTAEEQPNYLVYVRSKDSDPLKKMWDKKVDTRVMIEVWQMIESQDEALKNAELEE